MRYKILGPPGTGKTSKLIELLEQELSKGTPPERIAFLTFTKAARIEALSRTGRKETDFPFLRTIHAICYRQLNIDQTEVVKPQDLRRFGRYLGVKVNGNQVDPWIEEHERGWEPPTRDDLLLQTNHLGRHRGILLKDALQNASLEIDYHYAVWFTKAYKNWKTNEGLRDYTDLLLQYLDYGRPLNVDVIFVDEAQDLSHLQWEVVSKLGQNAKTWYVAGDDDQAIFNWAGADSSAFQGLTVDSTEILGQSYRVSQAIHSVAQNILSRIKVRIPKVYLPTQSKGEVADIGFLNTLDFKEKTFVLFRNHYRGFELARQLNEEGIPFIGHGSPLANEAVRAALLGWYHLIKKGEVPGHVAKKILRYVDQDQTFIEKREKLNKPTVTIGEMFVKIPHWYDWPRYLIHLPGKDVIDACIRRVGFYRTAKPNTELMSIHQSKGREAHTVVLDTEVSRVVYENLLTSGDDEHRVWYVAATRAKERLYSILPDGPYRYGL